MVIIAIKSTDDQTIQCTYFVLFRKKITPSTYDIYLNVLLKQFGNGIISVVFTASKIHFLLSL